MLCSSRLSRTLAPFGYEFQGNAVHAVAQAGGWRAVIKDVAKMPAATPAMDLGAFHQKTPIEFSAHRAVDRTPKARPPGPALELGLRLEQRKLAAGAGEDPLAMLVKKGAAEGRLRVLM